tara:strand:- start:1103 stop:1339 length:237 start_codon:yes stop_codon:yes gene_type:complete
MEIVNITEAKAQLSKLIEQVLNGEQVIIGKAGKPVAKLTKFTNADVVRKPGALKGKVVIHEDFDKLPPEIASAFGCEE